MGGAMIFIRSFDDTVHLQTKQDPEFRRGLIVKAARALLEGDLRTCEALLKQYIMDKNEKSNI